MWISDITTHVYREKGYPRRCDRCMEQLQKGQTYNRWAWRTGSKKLSISVEHVHDMDCSWEEFETLHKPPEEIQITIRTIISTRIVAKITINGETIFEPEPFVEMVYKPLTVETDNCDVSYATKDYEIPF